jgi:hypothetical protein
VRYVAGHKQVRQVRVGTMANLNRWQSVLQKWAKKKVGL